MTKRDMVEMLKGFSISIEEKLKENPELTISEIIEELDDLIYHFECEI